MKHKRFIQMCKDIPHLYRIYENHTANRIGHAIQESIFKHLKKSGGKIQYEESNIYAIRKIMESTLERQIEKGL